MPAMRHVVILTEARSSYGYLRPIARLIEADDALRYSLIVTNQHLLPDFGYSVEEIERDGLNITDRIYCALDGYTPATMNKSLGVLLLGITDALTRLKPDLVVVLGDRGDSLMAALAAHQMNIPVAHIQAGERSGNIDGMTRHAITRFAHIHFASGPDAAERLRRMGEEEFRIFVTGAPQLDELVNGESASREEIAAQFDLDLDEPVLLVLQHSVTEEVDATLEQMSETLEAVQELGYQSVVIFPNNDAGSEDVRMMIERHRRPFMRIERNVSRRTYLGLLRTATVLVGNSSSAIIEAPVFGLPAVNVGDRQRDRARAANVIDAPHDRAEIVRAVQTAASPEFRARVAADGESPYFSDGRVSERIVEILRTIPLDARLLRKQIDY
jgi:GDP/UDP-N,N'-diacetylbacillosamine 2-epimerase (hydrolysing)